MKKAVKYAVLVLIGAALIAGYLFTPARHYLTQDYITNVVNQFGALGWLVFMLLYFVLTLALLPATAFSVLGGALFGTFWGTVFVVTPATLAACVAFLIGRRFGKGVADRLSGSGKVGKWVKKIEKQCRMSGFQAFFILRCLFVPYMPVSYACGLVRSARLRDFALATLVTNIIFGFMFVYLGDSLLKGWNALILPAILVIFALQAPHIIKRFRKSNVIE